VVRTRIVAQTVIGPPIGTCASIPAERLKVGTDFTSSSTERSHAFAILRRREEATVLHAHIINGGREHYVRRCIVQPRDASGDQYRERTVVPRIGVIIVGGKGEDAGLRVLHLEGSGPGIGVDRLECDLITKICDGNATREGPMLGHSKTRVECSVAEGITLPLEVG
jgi:hypothetical protein